MLPTTMSVQNLFLSSSLPCNTSERANDDDKRNAKKKKYSKSNLRASKRGIFKAFHKNFAINQRKTFYSLLTQLSSVSQSLCQLHQQQSSSQERENKNKSSHFHSSRFI
jgi:hypothetical protein